MSRKWIGGAVVALSLFAGVYIGSPYLAVYNFKRAAISGDADRLTDTMDFPAVRESLKLQLSGGLRRLTTDPALRHNPLAGLSALLTPTISDRIVDAYVTPDAVAALAKGSTSARAADAQITGNPVDYRYDYIDLDHFRVRVSKRPGRTEAVAFVFERRGLLSWKLTRVDLPFGLFRPSEDAITAPE